MKKRELQALNKERCKLLIQKIDAKLVAAYKPEDWAQKLEQLFVLFGGEVDPKLLAIFLRIKVCQLWQKILIKAKARH